MVLDTEHDAEVATRRGLRRLFQLAAPEQVKHMARSLPGFQDMALRYSLLLELEGGKQEKGAISDRLATGAHRGDLRPRFFRGGCRDPRCGGVSRARGQGQDTAYRCGERGLPCDGRDPRRVPGAAPAHQPAGCAIWQRAMTDIRNQLKELLPPGFLLSTPLPAAETSPALP